MSGLTIDDPIRFADVLISQRIIPGDTLLLADGTYIGDWTVPVAISGTEAAPIIVKPQNPGKVIINGSLTINGSWTHWYDLEIMDARTDRHLITNSITMNYEGTRLHGCLIHDLHSDGVNWFGSGVGEVSECVLYNNGFRESDESAHGHGIYTHNTNGGQRTIARNIFNDAIGDYAFQIYSGGDNYLRDYVVEDNIIPDDPVHTGGGLGLINFLYQRNIQYGNYCQQGRYSGANANIDGTIKDNFFVGLSSYTVNQDTVPEWQNLVESGNEVYGGQPANRTGYTYYEQPATKSWIVAFSKSARWLGSVAIFNRDSADTVDVDFSSLLTNGNYLLRNGQNMTETWAFTYSGNAVSVPMNMWTAAARIGDTAQALVFPIFGAFVIEAA